MEDLQTDCIKGRQGEGIIVMSKILLVEDNYSIRQLLHMYFSEAGFAVIDACDGKQGFTIAKAEKPDLIITDLEMPIVNGTEMIKQLRGEPETANTPVWLFTGQGSFGVQESGANKTFYKPQDFDVLVSHVCELLPR
jgi:two-component system, chemotaxis family, chemotaxis protein CheY